MGQKGRLHIRISRTIDDSLESYISQLYEVTGVNVTKTAVVESALTEGLKILSMKIQTNNTIRRKE